MTADRKDERFFDFMCSCGEEAEKECDKVYEDVLKEFNEEVASYTKKNEITDRDFITYLVHKLDYMENGQANIEHIYTDMWSGVAVRYQYDYQEEVECDDDDDKCKCDSNYDCQWKIQDFWVECDQIHHGLARAYQLVKEFDKSLTK